ncbi:glycosyl hydrolase family 28-related protein [Anaerocolumna sp. MB42-C2]|uniref:glycosyl hydrolase family 28-related protein n=1 Tax=Anaerocolumna sp. MB42-C2 TaxID=3070997 RepID=UPI0027E18176|nr:glycosyl hydrolase family 28-related protein [Anaerocolumna sp. MB42-C2]WMJ89203.1 glycosyl hydrolase family 28-related protein [Anaerocolumna sp. MB42-C2]
MKNNITYRSIYQSCLEDEKVEVVTVNDGQELEPGKIDISDKLQNTLYHVKQKYGYGIVMLQEGDYYINKTIYIPRGIRLFGFGIKRPKITLIKNAAGFRLDREHTIKTAKYMCWFTANMPEKDEEVKDANPGTFYSALSNIDFAIESGNNNAVVIRAHFAQNCYVSYCHFEIGEGLAGIHSVGNEMEQLSFSGGDWGIYTGKCSPGWPFVMTDCYFTRQRKSGILCTQSGMTMARVVFEQIPVAVESMDGYWDKVIMKDCCFANLSTGILIASENNVCTQYNMRNILAEAVPIFAHMKDSKKNYHADSDQYIVKSFIHGAMAVYGNSEMEVKTVMELQNTPDKKYSCVSDTPDLPLQKDWTNIKKYGAIGDGITDDTEAIRRAIEDSDILYFPQGKYFISDTLSLKENTQLLGFLPIATQIILKDNTDKFAGIGAPKAMIETPVNGKNRIQSIGIDCAGRNPRAVAIKWQSGMSSYLYDIKFVGGHGRIDKDTEYLPAYNKTRTWDYNEDYQWDSQYWSLWITNQGGGTFKNLWTASPYAAAGIYISDTATKGIMYQVSSEHHVRQEILMKHVANWEFYGIQTEEEVAEGSYCQPFELSCCENLIFANLYAFRVIWVDNPYESVIRTWNCKKIEFQNFHNYTQMKYTILNAVYDANSKQTVGYWQLANLWIEDTETHIQMPDRSWEPKAILENLDCIDSMCADENGNLYICDSRLKRVYKWDQKTAKIELLLSTHYRPLSLACDTLGNLLMVVEYKPVKFAKKGETLELNIEEFGERSRQDFGACFYPFFRIDRRIRVLSMNTEKGESSVYELEPKLRSEVSLQKLYYPVNQWRDNGDMKTVIQLPDETCYIAPDGITGITNNPALARATGLCAVQKNGVFYAVDEYNKYVLKLKVDQNFNLHNPTIAVYRGEYSALAAENGELYVSDNLLYCYRGEQVRSLALAKRPACMIWKDKECKYLCISARSNLYIMKVKD